MMVQETTGIQEGSSQTASTGSNSLDQDAFLRLFTTQLQYQDPTNPMESYELAAQLAQFSTVQELTLLNQKVEEAEAYLASINNAQMIECIGKEIVGLSDLIQLEDGKISQMFYELDKPCQVVIHIYDDNDNLVRSLNVGYQEPGEYKVDWDGKDDQGNTVPDGLYRVEIDAVDGRGYAVEVDPTVSGVVYAFRVQDNTPYLILEDEDGVPLAVGAVREIRDADGLGAPGALACDNRSFKALLSPRSLPGLAGTLLSIF